MNYCQILKNLIKKKDGLVLTRDLEEENIPREYLSIFLEEDKLEKIKRGVYTTPDAFNDPIIPVLPSKSTIIYDII